MSEWIDASKELPPVVPFFGDISHGLSEQTLVIDEKDETYHAFYDWNDEVWTDTQSESVINNVKVWIKRG